MTDDRYWGSWLATVSALSGHPMMLATSSASEMRRMNSRLGLSWLAIILTCIDVLATTDVRREQEDLGGESHG